MNLLEISKKIDELGKAQAEFKQTNDLRLKKLESGATVDPLIEQKLNKLNQELDNLSQKTISQKRPILGSTKQRQSSMQYKQAFNDYVRKGLETEISNIQGVVSENGGYAVSEDVFGEIDTFLSQHSTIRKLSSPISISHDSFDIVSSKSDVEGCWSDGVLAANVSDAFEKKTIATYDLTAQPKVTQRILDDSHVDIEKWIANRVAEVFLNYENEAFIKGNGIEKPKGITNNSSVERIFNSIVNQIQVEDLMNLYYSLDDVYIKDAAFIMNRETVHKIRTLKDANGNYLWMPGLISGTSDTLLGTPLYTNQSVQTASESGSDVIIFGNLKQGYQIVDRGGVFVQRDPYTNKPFVTFFVTKRTGGDVVNAKAIKILRNI